MALKDASCTFGLKTYSTKCWCSVESASKVLCTVHGLVDKLIFLYVVIKAIRGGEKVTSQVWESAEGLEWTLSSPPPYHSFTTPPLIK